jgi:small-conductance mechanosensitive channel
VQQVRFRVLAIAISSTVISVGAISPVTAQIPFLPTLQPPTARSENSDGGTNVARWVYLDGRRLFQVAAPRANISERIDVIQWNLRQISQQYFQGSSEDINVQIKERNGLPTIYVNGRYLMTVTNQDANLRQVDLVTAANQISESLQQNLRQSKQERQRDNLIEQGVIAGGAGITIIVISWGLYQLQRRSQRHSLHHLNSPTPAEEPLTSQLKQQQQRNLLEVNKRLFQLTQTGLWGGGTLFILSLFPYTRGLQAWILYTLQFPVKLGVVVLGTYVAIRLSFLLIDRFASAFIGGSVLLTPETSQRLQLRVSTISGVAKSIITIIWLTVGILLALAVLGIDIIPLLAGAGIVGVAVSLASQNLIKDAINGFLIIFEDQYALGDVIMVGDVGGLVENLNLRMTQLRDGEGRLITIPNSEVRIVANLSSRWARADLTIPIAYQADIDLALKIIETVSLEMDRDPQWQHQILETPEVLGIDNFGERGLMIRVWIKTQPLQQWAVAREYRRRLKIALDQAGISIPLPQQVMWVNDSHLLKPLYDHSKGNGH